MTVQSDISPLLLASEVADLLRVSERTVLQWARDGLLPCVRIVREIRFNKSQIDTVMQKGLHTKCSKTYTPKKLKKYTPNRKGELMPWERGEKHQG